MNTLYLLNRSLFMRTCIVLLTAILFLTNCAKPPAAFDTLRQQVLDTEREFAQTMAKRDFQAFTSYLSEETVFFSGPTPLRGKKAVADWWKKYYEAEKAPFSWEPKQVEVLQSGQLALITGPVYDPEGKRIGEFTSIWRLEAPGKWRIVFDKGNEVCDSAKH